MIFECIFLMVSDVENLFIYLLAIFEKCLFRSFIHFYNWVNVFFARVVGVPYIFLILAPYHICGLHIFSSILWAVAFLLCW